MSAPVAALELDLEALGKKRFPSVMETELLITKHPEDVSKALYSCKVHRGRSAVVVARGR